MITFDGHYKLIDLDSASQVGKAIGKRVSTAYCPPEMIIDKPTPRPKIVHLRGGSTSTDEYQYLLADPSYDVWSCGILLYFLASGGLPFVINNFDCISSEEDLLGLFHWTEQYKSQKIPSVVNNLHNLSQQQQDKRPTKDILVQVHNLLTLLLQKDPSKRPSVPVLNIYEVQTHEQIDIEKGPVSVLSVSPSIQYGNFFEQSKNYPYNPAALPLQPIDSVEKKINELLDQFGYVASFLSAQGASACSVKNVWTRIVSNQGAFIEGEYEAAIERVSQAISEMVKHQH